MARHVGGSRTPPTCRQTDRTQDDAKGYVPMARLTQQTAIIGFGRLINMAAGAATLMVLARVLHNKADYGAVCQLIVLYMALSQVFAAGLPQSNYYFLPRYTGGARRGFLTQTVSLLMLSGAVLGLGLFFGADVLGRLLDSPQLPTLLRIFAIYPLFMMPTLAVESTLLHSDRAMTTMFFNAAVRVGMFLGLVLPTLLHMTLPQTIAIWMMVAGVMWATALLLIYSTVRGLPFSWNRQMLREEWTISMPLAIGTLLALCTAYLDRFLVSHVFGAVTFGTYTNATLEIPTVSMVTNAMAVVLTAELCKHTPSQENPSDLLIWRGALAKAGIVLFASLGFLAFWGNETMRLVFSDRFADSGAIFSIYVWTIPGQMFIIQPLLIARGLPQLMIYFRVNIFIIELCFVLTLGHFFGLLGIAFGVVLAQYVGITVGLYWFLHWVTKSTWDAILPWRVLVPSLLVAVVAGAMSRVTLVILHGRGPLIVHFIIGLLLFMAAYLLGLNYIKLLAIVLPARYWPLKGAEQRKIMK